MAVILLVVGVAVLALMAVYTYTRGYKFQSKRQQKLIQLLGNQLPGMRLGNQPPILVEHWPNLKLWLQIEDDYRRAKIALCVYCERQDGRFVRLLLDETKLRLPIGVSAILFVAHCQMWVETDDDGRKELWNVQARAAKLIETPQDQTQP